MNSICANSYVALIRLHSFCMLNICRTACIHYFVHVDGGGQLKKYQKWLVSPLPKKKSSFIKWLIIYSALTMYKQDWLRDIYYQKGPFPLLSIKDPDSNPHSSQNLPANLANCYSVYQYFGGKGEGEECACCLGLWREAITEVSYIII